MELHRVVAILDHRHHNDRQDTHACSMAQSTEHLIKRMEQSENSQAAIQSRALSRFRVWQRCPENSARQGGDYFLRHRRDPPYAAVFIQSRRHDGTLIQVFLQVSEIGASAKKLFVEAYALGEWSV